MSRAFTLIEMVVSLSILSIVFLSMGSVMMLAAMAVPDSKDTSSQALQASDVLHQITSELQEAKTIVAAYEKQIAFTVADRDGNGSPETIIYSWSGVPGGPLLRKYNGSAAVPILPGVYEFSLVYETSPDMTVGLTESNEIELISHNSLLDLHDGNVEHDKWLAQYFKPTLPAEAVAWSVKRIKFMAKSHSDVLPTTIQMCLPTLNESKPSTTVIDSSVLQGSELSDSYIWIEKTFSNTDSLDPDTGLFITFTAENGNTAKLRYHDKNILKPRISLSLGEPAWRWGAPQSVDSLLFYVYGTYSTPDPDWVPTGGPVRSVTLTLNAGQGSSSRVFTRVLTLNQPEMPTP